jgi:hypothetical protein
MAEFLVKGVAFQHQDAVWRGLLTKEEYTRVAQACPPEALKLMQTPPLAIAWIDGELSNQFSRTVSQELGERGLQLNELAGAAMLERDLKTIYKVLLRIATVDFALQRANATYQTYVKNGGSLVGERKDAATVVVHCRQLADRTLTNMWFIGGTTLGVLRAAGARNVRITERAETGDGFDITLRYDP